MTPLLDVWRATIDAIVTAFSEGDFELQRGIANVEPTSERLALQRRFFVSSSGETLTTSWSAAGASFIGTGWDVVVRLKTVETSGFVFDLRVVEHEGSYRFTGGLIYRE